MKFNELKTAPVKSGKRVGRGISAGQGKTAGRGTKGQKSRTGSSKKPGFEGGQNPLIQRLPKLRGFKSYKVKVENVLVSELGLLKGENVTNVSLAEAGLVSSAHTFVKLIGKAKLEKKYTVKLQSASAGAIESLKKAGGEFVKVERLPREAKKSDKKSQK